jgi:hypothetical protein
MWIQQDHNLIPQNDCRRRKTIYGSNQARRNQGLEFGLHQPLSNMFDNSWDSETSTNDSSLIYWI